MKDLERVRKALFKKPPKKLNALYKKAYKNYMVFYTIKENLKLYNVALPEEIRDKYYHYWRLTDVIIDVQHRIRHAPVMFKSIVDWEAKHGAQPYMWDNYKEFTKDLPRERRPEIPFSKLRLSEQLKSVYAIASRLLLDYCAGERPGS